MNRQTYKHTHETDKKTVSKQFA